MSSVNFFVSYPLFLFVTVGFKSFYDKKSKLDKENKLPILSAYLLKILN